MRSSAALSVLLLSLSLFCRLLASRCATRRRQCHCLGRLNEMGSELQRVQAEVSLWNGSERNGSAWQNCPCPDLSFCHLSSPRSHIPFRCGCRFIHRFRSLLFPSPAELASSLLLHPRPSYTATCRAQSSIQVSALSRERLETGCILFHGARFMRAAFDRVGSAMV